MTKFIIIALVILAVVTLVACVSSNNVLNEIKTYDIASDIRSLNIEDGFMSVSVVCKKK